MGEGRGNQRGLMRGRGTRGIILETILQKVERTLKT
jgi:hypothetical protein